MRGAARIALAQRPEPRRARAVVQAAARLAKDGAAMEDSPAALVLVTISVLPSPSSVVVGSASGGGVSLVSLTAAALERRVAAIAAAVALVVPPPRVGRLAHQRGGLIRRRELRIDHREFRVDRPQLALELKRGRRTKAK